MRLEPIAFAEDLAVLLNSGADLDTALASIISAQPENSLKPILLEVHSKVRQGQSLDQALSGHPAWFDSYYLGMVKSGEVCGQLPTTLERLASQLESDQDLKSQVNSALIYPAILLFAMCLSLVLVVAVILPRLTDLFDSFAGQLSPAAKGLLIVGNFINSWGSWVLLGFVLLLLSSWVFRESLQPKATLLNLLRKIPILRRFSNQLEFARFTATLSSLLEAGLPQTEALTVAAESFNHPSNYDAMQTVILRVSEGLPFSQAIAEVDGLDGLHAHILEIGERGGQLPATLRLLSIRQQKEFTKSAHRIVLLVEPVLIIVLGVVVGLVIYAVFSALQNIGGVVL